MQRCMVHILMSTVLFFLATVSYLTEDTQFQPRALRRVDKASSQTNTLDLINGKTIAQHPAPHPVQHHLQLARRHARMKATQISQTTGGPHRKRHISRALTDCSSHPGYLFFHSTCTENGHRQAYRIHCYRSAIENGMGQIVGQSSRGRDEPNYFQVVGRCRETEICREGVQDRSSIFKKAYCVDHQNFVDLVLKGDNHNWKVRPARFPPR